jgi:hypothetical protein
VGEVFGLALVVFVVVVAVGVMGWGVTMVVTVYLLEESMIHGL